MDKDPPTPQAHEREPTGEQTPAPQRLALTLDIQSYLGQLEDWDITESQKREFIVAFWNLLVSIAELNLGIHPAQTAAAKGRSPAKGKPENTTEKTAKPAELSTFDTDDVLYYKSYYRTQIIDQSDGNAPSEESESAP